MYIHFVTVTLHRPHTIAIVEKCSNFFQYFNFQKDAAVYVVILSPLASKMLTQEPHVHMALFRCWCELKIILIEEIRIVFY